jgi:hypothetical protein
MNFVSSMPDLFCTYLAFTPDAFSINSELDFCSSSTSPDLIFSLFSKLNSSTNLLYEST